MRIGTCVGVIAGGCVLATSASAGFVNGRYEGAWNNLTFGSMGAASLDVSIVGTDGSFTLDLDGFVFGVIDPPAATVTGTVNPDGSVDFDITNPDPIFGATTVVTFDGTNWSSSMSNVLGGAAGGGFDLVTVEGTLIGGAFRSTYEIFIGSSDTSPFARGTLDLDFIPAPGGAMLIGCAGVIVVRRRR
jgi:hypothetical protein